MSQLVEKHRRYLPHYQETDHYYSLTWRLEGELPIHIQQSLRELKEIMLRLKKADSSEEELYLIRDYSEYIEKYDYQLGQYPPTGINLSEDNNGKIVCDAFQFYNKKLYDLHAYCVMPNHIHLLIWPFSESDGRQAYLSDIVRRIKSFTSKEIGGLNNKRGKLWRADYFDRQIRNCKDYYYTVQYILNNPVKAGLVQTQKDWSFSYYCEW